MTPIQISNYVSQILHNEGELSNFKIGDECHIIIKINEQEFEGISKNLNEALSSAIYQAIDQLENKKV